MTEKEIGQLIDVLYKIYPKLRVFMEKNEGMYDIVVDVQLKKKKDGDVE